MEESAIASLDVYLVSANSELLEGGKLYCETESGGERHPYNSCESFSALREQGCFGYTTIEISWEIRHEATCAKIKALALATSTPSHYFTLELANWWEPLPAELIPMSGGLRSDAGWAIEKQKRDELVGGKELRQLPLMEITSEPGHFEATLELIKGECGETRNRVEINATVLADFDSDGIAELLVEGYRLDRSDTCSLGTGNSIGASFSVVLKKASPDSQIIVLSIPGIN